MSLINQGEPQDNNPEILRQQAEILLDEMMAGAANTSHVASLSTPASQSNPAPNDDETIALDPESINHLSQHHISSAPQQHQPTPPDNINADEVPIATPMQSNPWLFSAAERYRQNGYISSPPPPANHVQPSNNMHGNDVYQDHANPTSYNHSLNGSTPNPSPSANGNHPDQSAAPPLSSPPPDGTFQPMPGLGPVTRQTVAPSISEPASEVAEMRVGSAISNLNGNTPNGQVNNKNLNTKKLNPKNSNLLPRMSVVNVQALQKEVLALEEEIDLIVPSSHPSNDRAHHLLHKAYTILQNDIERSAEVEYYMQQVRSIIQRTRQMYRSSKTYNRNLALYLGAWFLLALIILAASYLYRIDIELWLLRNISLGPENPIMQHLLAFAVTTSAGVLGSAVGALYNMYNYNRQTFGLFDRKYGLRGLLLPLIGILFGTFIYVLWAFAGNFLQIDNNLNLFAGTLLACIAFLFGMSQETIYGTRS